MKRKQPFVSSDWLPLNAALVRIGDSVESPALAASDLHYALLGGLPSAYRSQDHDGKTHHGELSPRLTGLDPGLQEQPPNQMRSHIREFVCLVTDMGRVALL